jgi:hypothetical protein
VDSLDIKYPPEIYALADEMYIKGGILEINLIDKDLYQFFILDDEMLEVEISKPFTKKFSSTCSCIVH